MRKILTTLALFAVLVAPAFASGERGDDSATSKGIDARGEIHAINESSVNLSHGPIPAIGWPAMKMDLPLLEGAKVDGVAAGDTVIITLEKGPNGMYGVRALKRAE